MLKSFDNHFGRVIIEEEYVRVYKPMDGKVEVWKKISKNKGDWLLEDTGTRYPIKEDDNAEDDKLVSEERAGPRGS